jgi:hypothetical protein
LDRTTAAARQRFGAWPIGADRQPCRRGAPPFCIRGRARTDRASSAEAATASAQAIAPILGEARAIWCRRQTRSGQTGDCPAASQVPYPSAARDFAHSLGFVANGRTVIAGAFVAPSRVGQSNVTKPLTRVGIRISLAQRGKACCSCHPQLVQKICLHNTANLPVHGVFAARRIPTIGGLECVERLRWSRWNRGRCCRPVG